MKRQRITIGSIVEINIQGNYFTYAQILGKAAYAFFDFKTEEKAKEFDFLANRPILFVTNVYDDAITTGKWIKVGKLPVRKDLEILPMQFIHDESNPGNFELYNPNTGDIIPSSREECQGLERAAVWEASHIEDRIRDYYNNVPCIWLEEDRKLFND